WFGTVRGRLGFLATERLLVFGTAGFAYGHGEVSGTVSNDLGGHLIFSGPDSIDCKANSVCLSGSSSYNSTGWTAGGGFEWALLNNFTVKVEYLHVPLGEETLRLVATAPSTGTRSE